MVQPIIRPVEQNLQPVAVSKRPQKTWGKIMLWLTAAIGLTAILSVVLSTTSIIKGRNRAIMVYMIGSDLESETAAASLDITEMKNSQFDPEHTKVLVYTGGTKKWALDEISENENAIFEIENNNINKVQTFSKRVMTDPQNIVNFVNYAYEKYPADMYDLVLWDHGGGPIFGYGYDENAMLGSPMKITKLAEALSRTNLVLSGKKFDLIGFDACLMGSIEVAKVLSDYSDYMIASEEFEPGDGWNYEFLNSLSKDYHIDNTEELGESIIDYYVSHYNDYAYNVDLSLSMVDLSRVSKLADSMDDLFSDIGEDINMKTFSQYSQLMTRNRVYGYVGRDSESYDLVDLWDLCGSMKGNYNERVEKIKTDFDDAIVYNRSNMDNTNGLSVYFLN